MSDKTTSSVGPRSFETISEEDGQDGSPWDKLLGDEKSTVPIIIKTEASSTTSRSGEEVSLHPQAIDLESNKLTRSKSLVHQRRNSSGLLAAIPRQLRNSFSLRGVHSEPSSVKDVPTTRNDSSLNLLLRYRQARYAARRVRKRVIFKHGDCNVVQWNVAKRRRRYLQDIFTTLVDAQWRWTLMVFALSFILSWLLFALIWWLIIFTHGDLNPPANNTDPIIPCLNNVNTFTGCFLFSVETQHTIGYGSRTTNEECPEAIFVMCLQSIVGVFIQAFMITREGEVLPFYQQELKVGADGEEDRLMFIWPMTIVHKINEKSPLYNLSAADMLRERFEIVVMLEGVIESTGMTTQARSSFLPSEILWGHRFETMVTFRKDTGEYEVDYTSFNNTYDVDTPLCSAKQLDELRATVSTSQKLDRLLGTIPKTFSNDTLDLSSVDSMSLDEHIEIKIPDARAKENRLLAQNNFVQNINEKSRNTSHNHLAVETGQELPKIQNHHEHESHKNGDAKEAHMHRSHSHASMKKVHGLTPNGIGHHGHENKVDDINRIKNLCPQIAKCEPAGGAPHHPHPCDGGRRRLTSSNPATPGIPGTPGTPATPSEAAQQRTPTQG
ncbi:ATP-sensitive inward rectifier potassium channel 12-like isoform X4 [Cydia fagiglandana]|uniref:ATP-sensitive inward rectifier potassium channel 12-like isoform X4 n=1 Tax=Cydia fagiglandana TaxID=1458189 RepID=UPI002FEE230C